MTAITVRLLKPAKAKIISYRGEVISRDERAISLVAVWTEDTNDLGYVVFETGDRFFEYFYSDRWYNVFAICRPDGTLKGWYCNVTRPALFTADTIESEDLELDVFVSADRQQIIVLDEDEFAARRFLESDPTTYTAARAALAELQDFARRGEEPFGEGA